MISKAACWPTATCSGALRDPTGGPDTSVPNPSGVEIVGIVPDCSTATELVPIGPT